MKRIILILSFFSICLSGFSSKVDEVYAMYFFVWNNTETFSGAGHISVAIENETGQLDYFTHYTESDGGGFMIKNTSFVEAYYYDSDSLGIQRSVPGLVMKIEIDGTKRKKILKVANKKIQNKWNLFKQNCADFAKSIFKKAGYDGGLAFLISTPYEMVKDLNDHNKVALNNGAISVVIGDMNGYLQTQPQAVPLTIKRYFTRIFKKEEALASN